MSCFSSATNTTSVGDPDPTKHVNYHVGMLLGVDDFNQEFAYLSGRDQWMARDLIGYGTVRGLKVTIEDTPGANPRVRVDPGVAVSPRGQMICVPSAQCAQLGDWLAANQTEVASPPAANLPLYVVLCYRACPSDDVPIVGEPCRTDDQLKAASRLTDDFCLKLRTTRPNQREENAVREFVGWLRQINIADSVVSIPLEDLLYAIRQAAQPWLESPPASPPYFPPDHFMYGSPPGSLGINSDDACSYLRAAFRLWVTELRPKWIARWHGCAPTHFPSDAEAEEDCVLLAEIDVPLKPSSPIELVLDELATVTANEDDRPYVVHMRMLQEWLLCGVKPTSSGGGGGGGPLNLNGDVVGPPANTVVQKLQTFPVNPIPPAEHQVLTFYSGMWAPKDPPPPPPPPPPLPNMAGDVVNTITNNSVANLQGTPLVLPSPVNASVNGQVLTARNGKLQLEALPAQAPPAVHNFVERPQGSALYSIVAAGVLAAAGGRPRAPSFNGLKWVSLDNKLGDVMLTFNDYLVPTTKFQYIVKVLAVMAKPGFFPIVTFKGFVKDGFVVNVLNGGQVSPELLKIVELMIEVSVYNAGKGA
jgi:hypothetical protein